jgi:hypothetical protein
LAHRLEDQPLVLLAVVDAANRIDGKVASTTRYGKPRLKEKASRPYGGSGRAWQEAEALGKKAFGIVVTATMIC